MSLSLQNKFRYSLILFLLILQPGNHAFAYRNVTYAQIKREGKIWGIDLSHHQANIDWNKLKTQKPYFIFLKATEGSTHRDTHYATYYKKARQSDIITGSYHFFSYKSKGKAQAKYFLRVAHLRKGDLPPVLDVEFRRNMPNDKKVTLEIKDFLETVTKSTGYKPIIYCDYDFYKRYLKGKLKQDYSMWICDYRRKPSGKWLFWQTTDSFKIAGIKSRVDFNLFNGGKNKLKSILIK
jgi:lysozyme